MTKIGRKIKYLTAIALIVLSLLTVFGLGNKSSIVSWLDKNTRPDLVPKPPLLNLSTSPLLAPITKVLPYDSLFANYHSFSQDSKYGIKDIFGDIVHHAQFENVQILDNLFIVSKNNSYSLYDAITLLKENIALDNLVFVNSSILQSDSGLHNIHDIINGNFAPLSIQGYTAISANQSNFVVIANKDNLYGLANLDGTIFVPPYFDTISSFFDDYCLASKTQQNTKNYFAISKSNDTPIPLPNFANFIPFSVSSGYVFYQDWFSNAFLIFDTASKNTWSLQNNSDSTTNQFSIFGNFLIVQNGDNFGFYNFKSGSIAQTFDSIIPIFVQSKSYFITSKEDKFDLIDTNLYPIVQGMENIEYDTNLRLQKDGYAQLYKFVLAIN